MCITLSLAKVVYIDSTLYLHRRQCLLKCSNKPLHHFVRFSLSVEKQSVHAYPSRLVSHHKMQQLVVARRGGVDHALVPTRDCGHC